jgi:hypothetical protein
MISSEADLHASVDRRAPIHRRRPSPLAHGVAYRLAWAVGLSGMLWLAVAWALA